MSTEVFFSVSEELNIFFYSCITGVFFGAVYDIFRCLRAALPHNRIMVFAEDFIFMTFCSICYFVFITVFARGQIRLFILGGNLVGFLAEHFTVGNIIVLVARAVFGFVRKRVFRPIFKGLGKPLSKISTKIGGFFKRKCTMLKKSEKSRKNHLKVDG